MGCDGLRYFYRSRAFELCFSGEVQLKKTMLRTSRFQNHVPARLHRHLVERVYWSFDVWQ